MNTPGENSLLFARLLGPRTDSVASGPFSVAVLLMPIRDSNAEDVCHPPLYQRCPVGRGFGAGLLFGFSSGRPLECTRSLFNHGSHASKLDVVVFLMLILKPTGRHYGMPN